jgi:subtilisin family serine protease
VYPSNALQVVAGVYWGTIFLTLSLLSTFRYWASFYNQFGQWSGGSNCNYNLDVCAPGYKIWSTITKVGSFGTKYGLNDEYSGTSMAAPYVTGVIAKIWSQCPACSHVQVESCLKTTAEYIGPHPACYGSGLVQAEDAYHCLTTTCCSA